MLSAFRARPWPLLILGGLAWSFQPAVTARSLPQAAAAAPAAQTPAAVAAPVAAKRGMEPADILDWKTIGPAAVSPDGKWVIYRFTPVQGDGEVIIRSTDSDKTYRFPMGEIPPAQPSATQGPPPAGAAGAGAAVAFSGDSAFAAFTTYPSRREATRLRTQRKPVQTSVSLVALATGAPTVYSKVRRFTFSGESGAALALHRYGPEPAGGAGAAASVGGGGTPGGGAAAVSRPKGSDLILRDLASGQELMLGLVSEFAFDKAGTRVAWTIDADEQIGNGVHLRDLSSGVVRSLDSGKATYEQLAWTEEGDALAVLKGTEDKAYEQKRYAVLGFRKLGDATPERVAYDPAKDTTFPAGMSVSANRAPQWTEDRAALLFGIAELKKKDAGESDTAASAGADAPAAEAPKPDAPKGDDSADKPDLVVWHWQDPRLQSQQQVQEDRDKRFSYLATWRITAQTFVRLTDESLRDVTVPPRGRWAFGSDRTPYELTASLEGRNYQDLHAIDLATGARTPIAKQVRWSYAASPDGTKLLYYGDGHYFVFDAAAGRATNITAKTPVSFVNVEDDHNVVTPPIPPEGWAADSQHVLLSDAWDVYRVPVTGDPAVNLTVNGKRDQLRYDRLSTVYADEKGIDLARPQYFLVTGDRTKKGGVALVSPGVTTPRMLAWDDAGYGRLMKARKADRVVYTRETASAFPDLVAAGLDFASPRTVSDGQAQVEPFTWSAGSRLIDFTSTAPKGGRGQKLQAALYLPANYQPGKKYPTIVYIYERLTDNLNRFAQPTANGFNKSVYTSNGYAVLMPDISYTINDPGMSAVWCVLPALQAAVATGIVDPARVGLHGHSWGGYQTSFLVTQTNAFKAAIAGAPLTNMVSMYSLVYKNTGGGNMAIFESSQGRFRGGYWDNWEAYVRNSPIAFAKQVTTPLVILHNDKDGAVDFTQGVEYYNTLRRLKRPVVMLQYVGENHGLVKPANRFDYTVRMREFFDHHLKGAPAPAWWTAGVPRLKMPDHLRDRQVAPKKKTPPPAPTPTAQP